MKYIAIDTSGEHLTIIVKNDEIILKFFENECGVNHSVCLMPKLEELLIKANLDIKNVDFIACVVGAGSFTGIRIGVSTAKALAMVSGKKILSITSFDCLAYNKNDGNYLAVIDAKHNSFYVCGYKNNQICLAPKFISFMELKELSKEYTFLTKEKIKDVDSEVVPLCDGLIKAIEVKQNEVSSDINSLKPLYVRKSQAEEGR